MVITIKELKKSYSVGKRRIDVLKGLDLEIEQGEMTAIMGRSGSGKSTLLNIMAGLNTADGGTYLYKEERVSEMNRDELADFRKRNVGLVLQNYALIDSKNVFDNIALPLRYSKYPKKEIKEKVNQILDDLKITALQNKSVDTLSGGEMQRVAIARALIQNPDLILADEPTGSLDEQTEGEILDLFTNLNQQGKTLVIVTHDKEVADCCHKTFYIRDGKCFPANSLDFKTADTT